MNTGHKTDFMTTGETATSTFFVAFFSFLWVERETTAFWICLSSLFCSLTEQLATTSSLVVEKTRGRRTTITTTTTTTHEFLDS